MGLIWSVMPKNITLKDTTGLNYPLLGEQQMTTVYEETEKGPLATTSNFPLMGSQLAQHE